MAQGQVTPKRIVFGPKSNSFFMPVIITCKFKEDLIKNESVRAVTTFFPL